MTQFNLTLLLSLYPLYVWVEEDNTLKHPIVSLPTPHVYPIFQMPVSFVNSIIRFVVYPFAPFIRFLLRLSSDFELKTKFPRSKNRRTWARIHTPHTHAPHAHTHSHTHHSHTHHSHKHHTHIHTHTSLPHTTHTHTHTTQHTHTHNTQHIHTHTQHTTHTTHIEIWCLRLTFLLGCLLTYLLDATQSSWEANLFSGNQEVPPHLLES